MWQRWKRRKKAVERKIARKSWPVKEFVPSPDGGLTPIAGDARARQNGPRRRKLLRGPK